MVSGQANDAPFRVLAPRLGRNLPGPRWVGRPSGAGVRAERRQRNPFSLRTAASRADAVPVLAVAGQGPGPEAGLELLLPPSEMTETSGDEKAPAPARAPSPGASLADVPATPPAASP